MPGLSRSAACLGMLLAVAVSAQPAPPGRSRSTAVFLTSDRCFACHNGLVAASGEDFSIGHAWSASMMANSSRDPYWQAGVRREVLDHPSVAAAIEAECSVCHMPMMRYEAHLAGREGQVFAHTRFDPASRADRLAADGVSCSLCHQIARERLGTRESFVGRFLIDEGGSGLRVAFGPYDVDAGRVRIMSSSSGFRPVRSEHIQQSELCATCHTLFTHTLDASGKAVAEFPEQMPYLEWLHSEYRRTKSCQSCHMPAVASPAPIASVLGQPREGVSRHDFLGGNFFMQRLLNRFRNELFVMASPGTLEQAAVRTIAHLQEETARVTIEDAAVRADSLEAFIRVENLAGHKLPTAYPSRRVWLHIVVRDRDKRTVFESGALAADGSIQGNDNDLDPHRFEPHYREIRAPDQVQIYEAVMGDAAGRPTTGLLSAMSYLKDNRLLPHGFDKRTAEKEIAVAGDAAADEDFAGGGDRLRLAIRVPHGAGPFEIVAELCYQPIAFRWAANLRAYRAFETQRFLRYFEAMASASAVVVSRAVAVR
ncbi:MAG: hypothetical protein RMI94_05325 [Bryobacterales bacterium]|nr:hypothetical protein [Bryobacteraceae bacterium]MDW8129950.1 hypothetical protein [Bryobacterales bacterium]